MHSSNRMWGCNSGVGLGPPYPPSLGNIPGKSGVEMSNIDAQLMNEDQSKEHYDLPNFQLLASYMSFELKGTVGLKNGLKIIYAFESRTSGKTRRVPWVGAVSLNLTISQTRSPKNDHQVTS